LISPRIRQLNRRIAKIGQPQVFSITIAKPNRRWPSPVDPKPRNLGGREIQSIKRAHGAIKVAIDILKSAGVQVPVQLYLACHVLNYSLRPKALTLQQITIQ